MTKSIKEVFELYEQHIRNHSRLSKGPELSLDQALKELEAIQQQEIAKAKLSGIRLGMNVPAHDAMVEIDKLKLSIEENLWTQQ